MESKEIINFYDEPGSGKISIEGTTVISNIVGKSWNTIISEIRNYSGLGVNPTVTVYGRSIHVGKQGTTDLVSTAGTTASLGFSVQKHGPINSTYWKEITTVESSLNEAIADVKYLGIEDTARNASTLRGFAPEDFSLSTHTHTGFLDADGTAVNSDKLGNRPASDYLTKDTQSTVMYVNNSDIARYHDRNDGLTAQSAKATIESAINTIPEGHNCTIHLQGSTSTHKHEVSTVVDVTLKRIIIENDRQYISITPTGGFNIIKGTLSLEGGLISVAASKLVDIQDGGNLHIGGNLNTVVDIETPNFTLAHATGGHGNPVCTVTGERCNIITSEITTTNINMIGVSGNARVKGKFIDSTFFKPDFDNTIPFTDLTILANREGDDSVQFKVDDGTEDEHAVNKSQLDTEVTSLNASIDLKVE